MRRLPPARLAVACFLLVSLQTRPAPAQEDPHAGCDLPPSYVPAELLERAVPLRPGTGNSHEPVTTASKEAQAFYDQGLNYLESYVWIESARSFYQALRLDPKLAMAHVGLSRVYSGLNNPEAAQRFLAKAKELAAGASERERRRIAIREQQLAAMADLTDAAAQAAYKRALDEALAKDFADPQLWLLRGNAEEPTAAGRGQRGGASSVAFYEKVLQLVPDHASAHHFLVHSFETIGRIDEALAHGEVYARLAPAIPHAAHMWAHDLRRVGRVDEAIVQFRRADELERAYYAAEGIEAGFDWHHGHNLDLLATCYQHKGQMKLAEEIMREAVGLPAHEAMRAYSQRELPNFLIHRGRYAEALEAARAMGRSSFPAARTVGFALAGQAEIGLGHVEEAKEALAQAEHELQALAVVTPGIEPSRGMVAPWVDGLRGELLLRNPAKQTEGRELLQEVERRLRAVPGPDAWTQTLFRLESIARSAREAGAWDLAEYTAVQMLEHDAAYGGSHLALALVLQHRGDAAGAARETAEARRFWRDADPDLAELRLIEGTTAPAR